jgi:Uma2 family endonuclease
MRVKVEARCDYTYPDVTAVCGEPRFEGGTLDTLVNPTLLVEVLSPSTQDYDRGGKFALYRTIDSLQDYVLIAQDQVRVEHYARQGPLQWLLTEYTNLGDTLTLPALGVTLGLSDIYRKVLP